MLKAFAQFYRFGREYIYIIWNIIGESSVAESNQFNECLQR